MATRRIDIPQEFSAGVRVFGQKPEYSGTEGAFSIISVIVKNIYVIASIILLIFVIMGGVGMVINAGNAEKQKQSSKTLTSAVAGYLILFASYWIIKIIELVTGIKILSLT